MRGTDSVEMEVVLQVFCRSGSRCWSQGLKVLGVVDNAKDVAGKLCPRAWTSEVDGQ